MHIPQASPTFIGDAERDLVCDQLSAHFASGHLPQHDFDQRLLTALQARTRGELRTALAGLPSPVTATAPAPASERRGLTPADALIAFVALSAVVCLFGVLGMASSSESSEFVVGLFLGSLAGCAIGFGTAHLLHRGRN